MGEKQMLLGMHLGVKKEMNTLTSLFPTSHQWPRALGNIEISSQCKAQSNGPEGTQAQDQPRVILRNTNALYKC